MRNNHVRGNGFIGKLRDGRMGVIMGVALLLVTLMLAGCTVTPPSGEGPNQEETHVPKEFSPKNVIMISVQDLGDGVIDTLYGGKELTPFLNSLRPEYDYYKNNITAGAYASGLDVIMSSSAYGPQYNQPIAGLEGEKINTLGKILAEKGFYTLAVTSGPNGAYGGKKTYQSFGYEDFVSVEVDDLGKTSVYDKAVEMLRSNDSEHFFLSVTDLGLYVGKTDIEANEIGGSVDVAYYAKRMSYVDSAIAGFIEDLKTEGLYDDTIVVITGTGAAFELTDAQAMAGMDALMGGYTLENYIKAPLFVKIPGHKTEVSDRLVSHNDVFVTLADCLGIDDSSLWLNGSLLKEGHDKIYLQSVLGRGSYIDATSIVNAHESGKGVRSKLYDRATGNITPATDKQSEIDAGIAYFEDYDQKLTYGLSTLCYEQGTKEAMAAFEQNKGGVTVTPEKNVADVFPADEDPDFYKSEIDLCNECLLLSANQFKGEYISVMFKDGGLMLMPGCKEGTFISDEIYLGGPFEQMLASWNSSSTGGTVEVSVSVRLDDGSYTGWYSWGVWSAIRGLSGSASTEDENGEVGIDILTLNKECQGYVKYRIDIKQTKKESPIVYNVILAGDKATSNLQAPTNTYWKLNVPYRRQADVPEIGGQICSATSLSMILLYLGEEGLDVGDVAWGVRDYGAKRFGNWAYNVAYAGELGYIAYIDYFDIDAIKWAVYTGHPVACSIKVKQGQMADSGFPNYKTNGHLLCVVGYEERNGQKWLLINDPADPTVKAILESDFEKIYRGVSYIVQVRPERSLED